MSAANPQHANKPKQWRSWFGYLWAQLNPKLRKVEQEQRFSPSRLMATSIGRFMADPNYQVLGHVSKKSSQTKLDRTLFDTLGYLIYHKNTGEYYFHCTPTGDVEDVKGVTTLRSTTDILKSMLDNKASFAKLTVPNEYTFVPNDEIAAAKSTFDNLGFEKLKHIVVPHAENRKKAHWVSIDIELNTKGNSSNQNQSMVKNITYIDSMSRSRIRGFFSRLLPCFFHSNRQAVKTLSTLNPQNKTTVRYMGTQATFDTNNCGSYTVRTLFKRCDTRGARMNDIGLADRFLDDNAAHYDIVKNNKTMMPFLQQSNDERYKNQSNGSDNSNSEVAAIDDDEFDSFSDSPRNR